jgi:hypothetical protein
MSHRKEKAPKCVLGAFRMDRSFSQISGGIKYVDFSKVKRRRDG